MTAKQSLGPKHLLNIPRRRCSNSYVDMVHRIQESAVRPRLHPRTELKARGMRHVYVFRCPRLWGSGMASILQTDSRNISKADAREIPRARG